MVTVAQESISRGSDSQPCAPAWPDSCAPVHPPPLFRVARPPQVNADAETMAEFTRRVNEYVALHKKLEATLPNLPKEATPQQIDEHQRALGKLIQEARTGAKPGDLFTPDMRRIVRKLLATVFHGTGRAAGEALDPR